VDCVRRVHVTGTVTDAYGVDANSVGATAHSCASVLETLLTAQTRLVLPTAIHTEDRRERSTQTDRHENIDAS